MKNLNPTLRFNLTAVVLAAALLFTGLLASGAGDFVTLDDLFDDEIGATGPKISDPLEPINRVVFHFNDFLFLWVMQPIAETYKIVTPDPIESSLTNFFNNLAFPKRFVANLAQGKWEGAYVETGRFLVNSTVGLGGIKRPADSIEMLKPIENEDMGQALGALGIGHGPYLILPVFGPSSARDFAGFMGDRAVDPFKYPFIQVDDWKLRTGYGVGGIIVKSPTIVKTYRQMKMGSLDSYVALRNGYFQYRKAAVED